MIRVATILCLLVATGLAAPKKPAKPAAKRAPSEEVKPADPGVEPKPEPKRDDEAQRIHAEALKAFAQGDLEGAAAGYQRVLALTPENAPALINLALVRQRQKKYPEADELLKRVLRNDVTNASAWLIMGIAAYDQGKLEAAHAHLAQAVLHAPKNPQARLYLGVTLGRKGWYSAGEDELRRALEINPKFAEAHYNLAVLCMERVPPAVELGRRHYTKALELGAAPDPELAKKIGQ